MNGNSAFRWNERAALRAFVQERGFGVLMAATPDGLRAVHVPFVFLDDERIGFHLGRGNPIAKSLDGCDALMVVNGPDGYISPDWYALDNNQVPTWNYLAAELEGSVARLDRAALITQIEALTAAHEDRLAPKPAWTREKMDGGRFEKMLDAIQGFQLRVTAWRGTAKLGQNKSEIPRNKAADAVAASGNLPLADLMRAFPNV